MPRSLLFILLSVSLGANAALVTRLLFRSPQANVVISPADLSSELGPRPSTEITLENFLRAPLTELIAELRALNLDRDTMWAIAHARVSQNHRAAIARLTPPPPGWWQPRHSASPERVALYQKLGDLQKSIVEETGRALDVPTRPAPDVRWQFLPQDKIDAVQEVTDNYSNLRMSSATRSTLDDDQLATLEAEKQRDISALLTADEYQEYLLRFSKTGDQLYHRAAISDMSEAEYRTLFPLLHSLEQIKGLDRLEASATVQAEIVRQLGPERAAEFLWKGDSFLSADLYANLNTLAREHQLGATTAHEFLSLRSHSSIEAMAIGHDTTLSPAQRRAALAELAAETRVAVERLLPASARSSLPTNTFEWLELMPQGQLRVFDPISRTMTSSTVLVRDPGEN